MSKEIWFSISGLVNSLTSLLLAFFLVTRKDKSGVSFTFSLFCFAVAAWSIPYIFWPLSDTSQSTLFWFQLLHIGATFASVTYLHFVSIWLNIYKKNKKIIYFGYIFSLLIVFTIPTNLFIAGMVPKFSMNYWAVPGPMYYVYLINFFGFAIYSTYLLLKYLKITSGVRKHQIRLLLIGLSLAYIGGSTNYFLWFNINIPPYLNILVTGYVLITAYAILAHHLFDIRVIIKRTVVYSILLAFVLGVYSLVILVFAQIFGTGGAITVKTITPSLIATILIVAGFDPLRRILTKWTDSFLFKGEYEPQDILNKLAEVLSSVLDLDEALTSIINTLLSEMRLTQAAAFVLTHDPEMKRMVVKRAKSVGYGEEKITLNPRGHLITYFEQYIKLHKKVICGNTHNKNEANIKKCSIKIESKPIITEELSRYIESNNDSNKILKNTIEELNKLKASVALPIIVKGNLIGVFILGSKKSGDIFAESDLELLTSVANQTATAIEKARFYEEDQLKSEFVSIASHELLTPTSAIEGYLSMILDEGMGKVDAQARKYLVNVYASSKRLAGLVKDLLNVSRIEGGRILIQSKNFDIRETIKQVVVEMQPKAKQKNIELVAENIDRDMPQVWADSERVHQVLVNLIGNAIKYTDKGSIRVRLDFSLSVVRVSIIDTGVGIPQDEISHLFEKFYRASNADNSGAQGTGLGLYITKQMVELMGGMIQVDSQINKGSVFSFSLPKEKNE